MSDFVTIAQAKSDLSGNIIFKVISLGELKTGNSKTGEAYEKQDVVIKDSSGAMNLTLWNKNIGALDAGMFYSLENAWWNEYKNKAQLALGDYYDLVKITETDFIKREVSSNPNQPTLAESTKKVYATTPPAPLLKGVDEKLDAILNELDLVKNMVEPLFKKMVDEQIGRSKNV